MACLRVYVGINSRTVVILHFNSYHTACALSLSVDIYTCRRNPAEMLVGETLTNTDERGLLYIYLKLNGFHFELELRWA